VPSPKTSVFASRTSTLPAIRRIFSSGRRNWPRTHSLTTFDSPSSREGFLSSGAETFPQSPRAAIAKRTGIGRMRLPPIEVFTKRFGQFPHFSRRHLTAEFSDRRAGGTGRCHRLTHAGSLQRLVRYCVRPLNPA